MIHFNMAPPASARFDVGTMYSASEIQSRLNVGNAGGVRLCLSEDKEVKRLVIMTSASAAKVKRENPYYDRMEGDILVYTGAGREGIKRSAGPISGFRSNRIGYFRSTAFDRRRADATSRSGRIGGSSSDCSNIFAIIPKHNSMRETLRGKYGSSN